MEREGALGIQVEGHEKSMDELWSQETKVEVPAVIYQVCDLGQVTCLL